MRRVSIDRPGGYDRLRIEEASTPALRPGSVRIDVEAIGVNYADCITRMGLYASANRMRGFPMTPGFEVAGRIGAVGEGVHGLAHGDAVMALSLFDAYASQVVVPAHNVIAIPAGIAMAAAAAFPAAHVTAWYALHELARPRAGDAVLVHSAAGGVGGALVRLAKLAGCRVVAVVGGAHKVAAASGAGADVVIDKSGEPLWPAVERASRGGFHAVFDANGVSTLMRSYRSVAPGGRLVVYGFHSMLPRRGGTPNRLALAWKYLRTPRFDPLRMTTSNRSVMAFNLSFMADRAPLIREAMERTVALLEAGRLPPPPVTTYPFEEVARAHSDLESGRTIGKLVLVL
jgi:NADPH:quinone reductase-like Zn-dependent oxidoreductase